MIDDDYDHQWSRWCIYEYDAIDAFNNIIVILQREIITMMEFTWSGFYFRALSVLDLRVFLHLNFQNSLCSLYMLLLVNACFNGWFAGWIII